MSLIVVEGLDGAGKSTQINLLEKHLTGTGKRCRFLHFPRMEAPYFGELITRFLRGEFGKLEEVNPYLVAMIYAGDRMDSAPELRSWLADGEIVLLDRYVYSNIAYQCAKLEPAVEKDKLRRWILNLEFEHFGIPRPFLNLFLDVPFEFTRSKLNSQRVGSDRNYLNGQIDIHESSLSFQERVRQVYLDTARIDNTLEILDCAGDKGEIDTPMNIHHRILRLLEKKGALK